MFNKIVQAIKDPKILTAFGVGLIAPKIVEVLGKTACKLVRAKKQHSHIYVGIELGGTNYNIAFGKPEFDKSGNLIDFKLFKQASGRVSDKPQ